MDDASWEFLCNNSPKLVVKQRPKTPNSFFETVYDGEVHCFLSNSSNKQKLTKQPSNITKSSFRSIYREPTPQKCSSKKVSKILIAPSRILKSPLVSSYMAKPLSPLRCVKNSHISPRRFLVKGLKKLV
ncbi:hypothetical protein SteCoe_37008 [Stentor coeruleus]|uniref:Uncharacterized protein n=1 Tax=Stentor coeruleus TaxID=5963 RepID=A0A1R2AP12_9CILI|nr:hypothetical protein SteCoe_37008 [Stentor coeruleus]